MARAPLKRPSNSVNDKDNIKVAKPAPKDVAKPAAPPTSSRRQAPPTRRPLAPVDDKYEEDIYKYLVYHEQKYTIGDKKFLEYEIKSKMRRITVDWMIQVHWKFRLNPETLHLAVSILDRMIELRKVEKEKLQLVGITAMFIATKYEDIDLPHRDDYSCVTDYSCSSEDILYMEKSILQTLRFDISAPSSLVFCRCVSNFLKEKYEKFDGSWKNPKYMSLMIGEFALMDSTLATIGKAKIASATWHLVMEVLEVDGVERKKAQRAIREQLGVKKEEMFEVVELVAKATYIHFNHEKLVAVKKKYRSTKFDKVSKLLEGPLLEKIQTIGKLLP